MNNPLGGSPSKGNQGPHEAKKKSFDLGGNRTHDLRIRSTVSLPTELRGREKVAAQHSYVPLISLRRDSPPKSFPTFSVRPRSSFGRVTVDLIRRSWVRFPPRSKDFFFASRLIPFTRANAQWVIHGFN